MNKVDFSNYQFRCSSLGMLMTDPRAKKETLSETTKSYLLEVYISEVYGRDKDTSNKYCEKGLHTEEDSLDLVTNRLGKLIVKNKEQLSNEWIKGTPDVIQPDEVDDIKSSWDIWSFAKVDGTNKDYYWQLQGYMWLTGKQKARLFYCLNDTPEHLIVNEKSRLMYKVPFSPDSEEFQKLEMEIEHNMIYKDIPEEKKVKAFDFTFDDWQIERLKQRIIYARDYLNALDI